MKKNRGSLTLEAALFLTMFMIAYLAFIDLVQVARAQMILQYTVNETAKELSQNTYILTKAGIVDKSIETGKESQAFVEQTNKMVDSVKDFANVLENGGNVIEQTQVTVENTYDYFKDSDQILDGLFALAKNYASNAGKEFLIGEVCKGALERQLGYISTEEPDEYLRKLGLANGLEDISFEGTKWFDGKRELDIIMTYKIKIKLGVLGEWERIFKARAKTAIW